MKQTSPPSKVLVYQSVGFCVLIGLSWLDEWLGVSGLIHGPGRPPVFDLRECMLRMLLILAVWLLVLSSTRRVLARLRHLEEFLRVCSWCRRIDFKGSWMPLEQFLHQGFDTPTTHGICDACMEVQMAAVRGPRAKPNAPHPVLAELEQKSVSFEQSRECPTDVSSQE